MAIMIQSHQNADLRYLSKRRRRHSFLSISADNKIVFLKKKAELNM
jgi:hypothetical protein